MRFNLESLDNEQLQSHAGIEGIADTFFHFDRGDVLCATCLQSLRDDIFEDGSVITVSTMGHCHGCGVADEATANDRGYLLERAYDNYDPGE